MWNFNHRCSDSRGERSSGLSLSSKLVMPSSEKATDFVAVKVSTIVITSMPFH